MLLSDRKHYHEAIALAQAGNKGDAYEIFIKLRDLYPDHVNLHLWIAYTASNLAVAGAAFATAATLAPDHPQIPHAMAWLAKEEERRQSPVSSDTEDPRETFPF